MREEREEKVEKVEVRVRELAYRKIVYHLVRYPTSKVTGALVGNEFEVVDAYPLFHTPIVNPPLSVALDLIESNLPEGQKILGFYEFVEGSEPKITSLIESNPQMKDMIAMRVRVNAEKQVNFSSAKFNFTTPQWAIAAEGLKKGEYRFLVDFDAHFEEVELDFRNTYIQ